MSKVSIVVKDITYPMYETMRYTVEMQRAGKSNAVYVELVDPAQGLIPENIKSVDVETHLLSAYWMIRGACAREKRDFPFTFEEFIDVAPDETIMKLYEARFNVTAKQEATDKKKDA